MSEEFTSCNHLSTDSGFQTCDSSQNLGDRTQSSIRNTTDITNPFESQLSLLSNSCLGISPNMFKTPVSKPRPQSSFQWSVEQQARVNPATIDENFHYESPTNSDIDYAIQKRLDDFWSQPLIDPSPEIIKMVNNGPKPLNFSPSPITNISLSRRISARHLEYSASPVSRNRVMVSHEVQTDISIPNDFDLAAILADHLPCKGQVSSTPIKIKTPRENKFSTPKFDLQEVRLGVDLTFNEEGPSMRTEGDEFSNVTGFKDPFESSSVSPIKFEPLMESVFHQLSPIKETRE